MNRAGVRGIRPPPAVLGITRDLERAGFQAWCVGGAVRDALLGHTHLDWDLATDATPDEVRTVFGRKRTIPVGIEFGTVGVLDEAGVLHEVTTFRRDVRTDGRHAEVAFGASLDEDLARRDFTINAIAYSPSRDALHDPFGGRADLDRRLIRAVGAASERMREDRLRALRALRFAARLDFEIERDTWDAIRESAPHLGRLSAERVKQEIEKTMEQVSAPSRAFARWLESGAMRVLVPELADVTPETLRAIDCAAQPLPKHRPTRPARLPIRIAVLFGDVPSRAAAEALARLRFSRLEGQWIARMVELWQSTAPRIAEELRTGSVPPSGAQVRRWAARIGRLDLGAFCRVASAHWAARRIGDPRSVPAARRVHSLYRRMRRTALREPLDVRDLAVDGDDLRAAGIAPGPGLGKILVTLLDLVLDDPERNERQFLLDEARRLHTGSR